MEKYLEKFRCYLIDLERSENTIQSYTKSVELFFRYFDELSKENLILFKKMLMESYKPKTVALRIVSMNVYCDYLEKPECKVKSIKICNESTLENVITNQEYIVFLEGLLNDGNIRMYYMIKFLASTGCRASELVSLKKDCLKKGESVMLTKGKYRRILIPRALIKESKAYFDTVESEYLFPNHDGEKLSTRAVTGLIHRWGSKYGIRKEVLHPHSFRHFFAINFLKKSKNIALLSDILGHESLNTTAIYLKLSAKEQKKLFNRVVQW